MSPAGAGDHRVTIAGGGIAALEAVLALRAMAGDVAIELLSPAARSDYQPLAVLEPFAFGEMPVLDLRRFAAEQRASLRRDTLVAVEAGAREIVTGRGERCPYDVLVVATGASTVEAVPGAHTFHGHVDRREAGLLVEEYAEGSLKRLAFAVPAGEAWALPAYELALMTRTMLSNRGVTDVDLAVVTPEERPLELFGPTVSRAIGKLLADASVDVYAGAAPDRFEDGALHLAGGTQVEADRVVALPRLVGRRFAGLPADERGFVPTDEHGRVDGHPDVYAAGDAAAFPVKQGGLAAQQADTVAAAIAARFGAGPEPPPFRPALHGLLMTGKVAFHLEPEDGEHPGLHPAPWSPPEKVFGRYLLPYLTGGKTLPLA